MQRARGHEVEDHLLVADDERVARVGAAAVAHDRVGLRGEQIHDLALALVAPLGAHDHQRRHARSLRPRLAPVFEPAPSARTQRASAPSVPASRVRASPSRTLRTSRAPRRHITVAS